MRATQRLRGVMVAVMVVGVMLSATAAQASPITYTFTGIGSGSVGNTSFTNKAFTLGFTGDTDNVVWNAGFGIWENQPIAPATIAIGGFGSGMFISPPLLVWGSPGYQAVGFGDAAYSYDYMYLFNALFVPYDLTTPFAPVSGPAGAGILSSYAVKANFGGQDQVLEITPSGDMTFSASVPDGGATLVLLGGVLMGLGALRRKFRA